MKKNLGFNKNGSVFISTMIATFLMTMVGGYLYKLTSQDIYYVHHLENSLQAQQLADAGAGRLLSTLNNIWASSGSISSTTLGPGSYSVSMSAVSGRYLIRSTGIANGVTRTATVEVKPPTISALNYVFAGGSVAAQIVDSGTGQSPGTITGDIYTAGNLTLDGPSSGGALTVTGKVDSAGTITLGSSATVSGTQTQNFSSTVSFPTVDFSYYQNIALANNGSNTTCLNCTTPVANYTKIYTDASRIPAAPAGGVIFINGNVVIQGTQTTTSCIIATGSITIDKSGSTYPMVTVNQYTSTDGLKYPALMTQNGDITYQSVGNGGTGITTTGLIYSGGNFNVTSANHDTFNFNGSILARGAINFNLTAQNSTTVTYAAQNPPGFTNGSASMSIVSYNT